MPEYEAVLYEQDGPVVTITWNRPQVLNSINETLENDFYDACKYADADPAVNHVARRRADAEIAAAPVLIRSVSPR